MPNDSIMTSAYETLLGDKELNYLLENINYNFNRLINFANGTSGLNWSFCCHGKHHALFVVDKVEYILTSLSYDNSVIELGKVAALLHDIGVYYQRENHARLSAEMSAHFISKTALNKNDYDVISHAILDHSTGTHIQSPMGAALIIADKMTDTKRDAPLKADLLKGGFTKAQVNECVNPIYKSPSTDYTVKDVRLDISNRNLIFNYVVEGDATIFLDKYFTKKLASKPITLTKNAAIYLNCNCIYKINDDKIETA